MFSLEDILGGRVSRAGDALEYFAQSSGNSLAVSDDTRVLSYSELAKELLIWKHELQDKGLRAGDRCVVVMENCTTAISLFYAIQSLDAWPIIVNARMTFNEIHWIIDHCKPRLVVFLGAESPPAAAHSKTMSAERLNLAGASIVGHLATKSEPVFDDAAQQTGVLIYTSGSTGKPKGVMLSHRTLLFNAAVVAQERGYSPEDSIYGLAPLSHSLGLGVLLSAMHSGAHYRAVARFDPADFVRLALAHKITVFNAPPAAYHRLMTYIEANDIDVSETRLRILGAGSAPLDPLLKERVTSAFRRPLHNGYGITETGPSIAFSRPNSPAPDMSIGPPLPHVETCIIDPKGRAVSIDDVGELWVRGPGLMLGYYKDPAATEAAFRPGGWFASGDLVSEDASGNLHVRGRLKELIIRSGFNVYPAEIESILNNDPSVAASAVVGKNVDGNEEIIAFIQPHRGQQPSIERLRTRLRESLAPYKQPSRIFVLEQLPQTATGKVLKHALVVSPQSESGSDEIADAAGKN